MFETNVHGLHPRAHQAPGLHEFTAPATARTCSNHSIEVAHLSASLAAEIGFSMWRSKRPACCMIWASPSTTRWRAPVQIGVELAGSTGE